MSPMLDKTDDILSKSAYNVGKLGQICVLRSVALLFLSVTVQNVI